MKLTAVKFRSKPDADQTFEITDLSGNKVGTAPHDTGPEQRAAVAKALGVQPDHVQYKSEGEDETGTYELWTVKADSIPLRQRFPNLDHSLAAAMHGAGLANILFGTPRRS